MKNIFLSGEIKVGKSTIINKMINNLNIDEKDIGGFRTKAFLVNNVLMGFYMEPINIDIKIPDVKDRLIGYTPDGTRWVGNDSTFEGFGVKILNYCLNAPFKLILMDELGFFENNSFNFQKRVHMVLDTETKVLGCIKPTSTRFMDSIRNRKDVIEVGITKENRDSMPTILQKKFFCME